MKITKPSSALSVRAKKCLRLAGVPAEKAAVRNALKFGDLHPFLQAPLYNETIQKELCRWVSLHECEAGIYHDFNLSYRAWIRLVRSGVPVSKPGILKALKTGILTPGKRPAGYGKITHAELCRCVGLDPATLQPVEGGNLRRRVHCPLRAPCSVLRASSGL